MKKVIIILELLVLIGIVAFGGWRYYKTCGDAFDPQSTETVLMTVESGSTTSSIAEQLEEAGIIKSVNRFKLYVRLNDYDGLFKAGTYTFSPSMDAKTICDMLESGIQTLNYFTIPEGYTTREIADKFMFEGKIDYQNFMFEVINGEFNYSFLEGAPAGEHRLEGFMFPETYLLPPGITEHELIDLTLSHFNEIYSKYAKQAEERGLTPLEAITIASIIEKETVLKEEQPLVSSVIHNRLKERMNLGMDTTIIFITGNATWDLTQSELEIDSPYNTYRYPGLPPGPICVPGESAIAAAVNPADTKYLYFVVAPELDGSMRFSETYEQFEKDVEEFEKAYNG